MPEVANSLESSVINSGQSCDDKADMSHIDDDDLETAAVCVDSTMYYLIGAKGDEARTCDLSHQSFNEGCVDNTFTILPGTDALNGTGTAWGGLTKEDIVNGLVFLIALNPPPPLFLKGTKKEKPSFTMLRLISLHAQG